MPKVEQKILVGTYTEPILFGTGKVLNGQGRGIYSFAIDTETGRSTPAGVLEGVRNPSYLTCAPEADLLFCVNELKDEDGRAGGMVSSFRMSAGATPSPGAARSPGAAHSAGATPSPGAAPTIRDGPASLISTRPTGGADPCYLTLDKTGSVLLTANYMSGSVCVHPVSPAGELGPMSDFHQHEGAGADPARQAGPHAHAVAVSPDNRFAFVPDLGIDAIVAYELNPVAGTLRERENLTLRMPPGAGPRHLVFSPDGLSAYVINELNSTITACRYEQDSGRLSETQTVSTLPEDYRGSSSGAHIAVSPCGRFLYSSNRGHDTIAAFRIESGTGTIALIDHFPSGGRCPRSFAIDPTGSLLVAANQDSDLLATFFLDRNTGALRATGTDIATGTGAGADMNIPVPTPVCVVFVSLPDRDMR
jgi:6-phosphogluconolactonase